MHIAVNAVALRTAGGRSVAINFLRAFEQNPDGNTISLFAPAGCGYEEFQTSENIRIHFMPALFHKLCLRPLGDRLWVRRQIERCDPDVIFSMGNFAVPTLRRQVLLFMWPYATYPESEVWDRMSSMDRWTRKAKIRAFRKRLKYATVVAPQTHTSLLRLQRYFPEARQLQVVPTAFAVNDAGVPLGENRRAGIVAAGKKKLLCLTRYYPHKNLEILLELGKLIRERNGPYAIITTIARDQHPDAARLLDRIDEAGLNDVILNIGPVPMDEVPALYQHAHGLLLPTLLESFSGTYVDAMYFRKPIFTSDRDFSRDVCGDGAFYFDPFSAQDMLDVIEKAFEDTERMEQMVDRAAGRLGAFPDWHEVAGMYLRLMRSIV